MTAAAALVALVFSGCGRSDSPTAPTTATQNLLSIISQPGDGIGGGRTYRFTADTARFRINQMYPGSLEINVDSNDRQSWWQFFIGAPAGQELRVGSYENAIGWSAAAAARPRLSLFGEGRGCSSEGRFTIAQLTYRGTIQLSSGNTVPAVEKLHVTFTQRCDATSAPELSGELMFVQ